MGFTLSPSLLFFFILIATSTTPFQKWALAQTPDLKDSVPTQNLWCVAKNNAEDATLQSALDWACGPGGADCGPIQTGGPCYDPQNFQSTASFAFNDYYVRVKHGASEDDCDFGSTAALSSLDPSHDKCKFPSRTLVVSNGSFVGSAGPGAEDYSNGCRIGRSSQPAITIGLIFFITIIFLRKM